MDQGLVDMTSPDPSTEASTPCGLTEVPDSDQIAAFERWLAEWLAGVSMEQQGEPEWDR